MQWLMSFALLATAISGVHLQCLSPNDDLAVTYSTDLSDINDFGLQLYKQLSPPQSKGNFFFSPYIIWTALTLAYFGSGGNTQKQLESRLNITDKLSTVKKWKELENLYERRQVNNSLYTFNLANRAYFHESLNIRPCMQKILQDEIRMVNFFNTVGSAKIINDFVSETTKGRISQVVNSDDLTDALMVLVNAAFFKGTWKYQFNSPDTTQKPFFITAQDSAPLAMMSQKGDFRYGESKQLGARILELPYSGEVMSMFLLLPDPSLPAEARFDNMVRNLNGRTLQEALRPNNLNINTVDVLLPRFKFEMELKKLEMALRNLGIVDLFDRRVANMTGFDPNENLSISKTIHKAFVEVNEEGTEAVAVTAVVIGSLKPGAPNEPLVIEFHCNEPFVFLIRDNQMNNVLFLGAMKNPRG